MGPRKSDIVILGAGIVGLSIAKEIRSRYPKISITIFDKEAEVGCHGSGRNSGVLHSGLYYPEKSLKAQFCAGGAKLLAEYCEEKKLPFRRCGKVVLPIKETDDPTLQMLHDRGIKNGAHPKLINSQELAELEPEARSLTGKALHVPDTAVFDPHSVIKSLTEDLKSNSVRFEFGSGFQDVSQDGFVSTKGENYQYDKLINTAGLHADKIARKFGHARQYSMLPFKGLYFEMRPERKLNVRSLIYPVPDLNVPFLGVHVTRGIHDKIYFGPSAIPALGRENYALFESIDWSDLPRMGKTIAIQYLSNKQGFRQYAHEEIGRFRKSSFLKAVHALVPGVRTEDLKRSQKVGIRAQLFDNSKKELVMDFLVEKHERVTHVLNAVSPGFTSAMSFSKFVLDRYVF